MKLFYVAIAGLILASCNKEVKKNTTSEELPVVAEVKNEIQFQNDAHKIIYESTQKTGTYQDLLEKKDVIYTYTYTLPDGSEDISTEKYIFDNELSYGEYTKHERTFPNLKGKVVQGYDGKEFWLKDNDSIINDEKMLKITTFKRGTNFYWFAMMQKLMDPNLNYEYIKKESVDGVEYDIVKVTFEPKGDKPTDIYQVYVNKKTKLIDQFLFTVIDFGKTEPMLMKVQYEEVEGMLIPSKRKYIQSNWEAKTETENWINVNWSNIKFNNNLSIEEFQK